MQEWLWRKREEGALGLPDRWSDLDPLRGLGPFPQQTSGLNRLPLCVRPTTQGSPRRIDLSVRSLALHHLTVPDLGPVEAVYAAAEAGFDAVSVRLLPPSPDDPPFALLDDDGLARRVLAAARETGVTIAEVDLVRLPADDAGDRLDRIVGRAASLGARHLVAVGQSADLPRLAAGIARLAALAAPHGITVLLEPVSWNPVRSLAQAAEVLRAVAQPNTGLLVDALHFHRMGESLDALAALPRHWLSLAHLCDAPVAPVPTSDEARRDEARTVRLMPGEGGLDLKAWIARLPLSAVLSVEIPNRRQLAELTPSARAERARRTTAGLLTHLR